MLNAAPPFSLSTARTRMSNNTGDPDPKDASRAIFNQHGVKLREQDSPVKGAIFERMVEQQQQASTPAVGMDARPIVSVQSIREAADAVLAGLPFFAQIADSSYVRTVLLEALGEIALPRPIALQLTLARDERPALFDHAIRMALLCAHLVRESGAPRHEVTIAATAGLVHDLGMLHIDPDSLSPDRRLEGAERKPLYAHSLTSSMVVGKFDEYPREIARAVLEHHERMDGSGYPRALQGDAISPLGRVLSLAEVVTSMFSQDRPFPVQRVSLMLRMSPRQFDPVLVASIHRLLRAMVSADEQPSLSAQASLERLRGQSDLLVAWRDAMPAQLAVLDPALAAPMLSVAAQVEALQRMLFDAGVQFDQLPALVEANPDDGALGIELWVLGEELQWQIRTLAAQVQRRWRGGDTGVELPQALAQWVAQANHTQS
jgi:HD-GYP domain-containing protein (c-di-GMP phosphodiesterase class II)